MALYIWPLSVEQLTGRYSSSYSLVEQVDILSQSKREKLLLFVHLTVGEVLLYLQHSHPSLHFSSGQFQTSTVLH